MVFYFPLYESVVAVKWCFHFANFMDHEEGQVAPIAIGKQKTPPYLYAKSGPVATNLFVKWNKRKTKKGPKTF